VLDMNCLTRRRPQAALPNTISATASQGKVFFAERLEAERPTKMANVSSFSLSPLALSTNTGFPLIKVVSLFHFARKYQAENE
jgi:hypothetical protein